MAVWAPGMSMEEVQFSTILAALAFYKDENRAADSLKITHKEMSKMIKKIDEFQQKIEEVKMIEKRKHDEFVLRARGKLS